MRRTQEERTEATRGAVLAAADTLFAKNGFADTSIEDILRAAKVTRGALYHHFASKADIFEAVFEEREKSLAAFITKRAAREKSRFAGLRTGCRAFLEACLDPAVQRIVLIDAWAVLSFETIRAIEGRYTMALLRDGIANAVRAGEIEVVSVEIVANMLLGALSQSAISIARSKQSVKEHTAALHELERLLTAYAKA